MSHGRQLIALVLAPLAPPLLLLVVMTHVPVPLALLLQWLISQCPLVALVLAPLTPFLQWLVSQCQLVALILAPLAPLLQWLISQCWLIALVLAVQDFYAFVPENEPLFCFFVGVPSEEGFI